MIKLLSSILIFLISASLVFAQTSGTTDFTKKIQALVENVLVKIIFAISAIEIAYAGFLFATAQGDPEKVKRAKDILIYAAVGIGVAVIAWLLAEFVAKTVKGKE